MFEFDIAYRYLRSGGGFVSLISGFSFAGITIGVSALIVVMSVMNGYHLRLAEHIVGVGGHVRVLNKSGEYLRNYDDILAIVEAVPGVVAASPVQNEEAVIMSDERVVGIYLSGIRHQSIMKDKPMLAGAIKRGSLSGLSGDAIAIGSELASNLKVDVGDTVTVISPKFFTSIVGTVPNMKDYEVCAIFEVGMLEYDSSVAYMDLQGVNTLFEALPGTASDIEVYISNIDDARDVAQRINQVMPGNIEAVTWMDTNGQLMHALRVERVVMFLILTLIIIVAAFNIISSLVILAQDRKSEIAILKTIGASDASIVSIFVICGANVGCFGTALGVTIGVLFASNIDAIRVFMERFVGVELFSPVIYF